MKHFFWLKRNTWTKVITWLLILYFWARLYSDWEYGPYSSAGELAALAGIGYAVGTRRIGIHEEEIGPQITRKRGPAAAGPYLSVFSFSSARASWA